MNDPRDDLDGLLSPVRDLSLSAVLEELSRAAFHGYDCQTDIGVRDKDGALERTLLLNLPRRYDLRARRQDRTSCIDVVDGRIIGFDPHDLTLDDGTCVRIRAFKWNDACFRFRTNDARPDWRPVRRWYLEAFQKRFGDNPDFAGTVHSLADPIRHLDGRWELRVDFGSAPVAALGDFLMSLRMVGVRYGIDLGEPTPDARADDETEAG
ncbi:hypothetical protein [Roseobacter sp. HKCCA0434]|uniref:hypothetical protein n=1 Tax=Roseobacter sp. HKCCA0434 TaxID=3079297 RepID=UPI002905B98C|nr:hypothetical protein [Roseobacter sp. HKCCA0434]